MERVLQAADRRGERNMEVLELTVAGSSCRVASEETVLHRWGRIAERPFCCFGSSSGYLELAIAAAALSENRKTCMLSVMAVTRTPPPI